MADELMLLNTDMKYEKSNMLIFGRFNMTKMAQKTLAYALSTLRGRKYNPEEMEKGISVSFTSAELRKILVNENAERGTLSKELKKIADNLHHKTVFMQSESNSEEFTSFNFIKTCKYEKDRFTMTFHEEMSPYLVNLNRNFTVLDVKNVKSMKSGYTIRMYEMCESYAYQARAHHGIIKKEFHFVELKLMLGLIDSENLDVREITEKYKSDYDMIGQKIEELYKTSSQKVAELNQKIKNIDSMGYSPEDREAYLKLYRDQRKVEADKVGTVNKYRNITNFRTKILEVAKEELLSLIQDDKINICFDYETLRRNHALYGFRIIIMTKEGLKNYMNDGRQLNMFDKDAEWKVPEAAAEYEDVEEVIFREVEPVNDEVEEELINFQKEVFEQVKELLSEYEDLSDHDIMAICREAKFDLMKIFKARLVMEKSKTPVKGVVGFMISAIREGYNAPVPGKKKGKSENQFNQFTQNEYDFDALEKKLTDN